ncbi:hypothetical protein GCM10010341_48840 [Streptomyces noursei]|nr:hypothetical protein GCM10010341_48840 [Streptomyces noursei]
MPFPLLSLSRVCLLSPHRRPAAGPGNLPSIRYRRSVPFHGVRTPVAVRGVVRVRTVPDQLLPGRAVLTQIMVDRLRSPAAGLRLEEF